jgi:hypothetical protein
VSTTALIIIVLVLLLFGGGYWGYGRYGYNGLGGVVGLVLVILLILFLTGMLNTVHAQTRQPVPILKSSRMVTSVEPAPAPLVSRQVTIPTARSMAGATRCEQIGTTITCDNGFTQQVERR